MPVTIMEVTTIAPAETTVASMISVDLLGFVWLDVSAGVGSSTVNPFSSV